MNLKKLFKMQKELDQDIVKRKGLEGQDLLPKKILALQVELGELANEWRGFKFWSENQKPRTKVGLTSFHAAREGKTRNPLLEEYVDCLHFILSIGIESKLTENVKVENWPSIKTESSFRLMYSFIEDFQKGSIQTRYNALFTEFHFLGESLGFTWDEIEQAYFDKNAINLERQRSGY
ncbi:dUTP diphosphatase [Alteribacter populi]|uniref:dUTP diphosphatase n=1 Tax=Alteribacter populi TaxID=2011011 RepID=UPI000BBB1B7B|nr:dUTP diphosphatase [Alteribacter populi]